ncbi:MAG: hypothetical protein ACLFR0_07265 [Alphaproteobacteria bacterium]
MTGVDDIITADDLKQRAMACDGVEILDFSEVIDGLPPSLCATAHPENFRVGEEVPNPEGSLLVKTNAGVYMSGAVSKQAQEDYAQNHPQADVQMDVAAQAKTASPLAAQFGIASLATYSEEPGEPNIKEDAPVAPRVDPLTPGVG